MARTRNATQGTSNATRHTNGSGSTRTTASGMRLRPRPLLKPPENVIRSPVIRKRKRPSTAGRAVHTTDTEPESPVIAPSPPVPPPQPSSPIVTRSTRSRAQAVSSRGRMPRRATPMALRSQALAGNALGTARTAQNNSDALPLRLVPERSPTPIPTRARTRNTANLFGSSSPTVIRVSAPRSRTHQAGERPGTSASESNGSVRVRSMRQRERVPPSPFLLTLRVDRNFQEAGTNTEHHILDREDSDRLRAFIDEHYFEDAEEIHREIVRAVRENFEGFRDTMNRRREVQETQRRRRGEAWLTRFTRPRRGAANIRYLPRAPCTICFEDDPVNPVGCNSCSQLIGCTECVGKWFGSSNCSELDPHATSGPSDNHSKCPLCRYPWIREPAVFSVSCELPENT